MAKSSTVDAPKTKRAAAVKTHKKETHATEEQKIYARLLDVGMKIGLVGIIVSFIAYVTSLIAPKIPLVEISNYWGMKSHEYLEAAHIQGGWTWLGMYNYGDFLNFFPIAFLASITIVCYIAIVPTLLKKKDTTYAVLAIAEILVLVGAASGLFGSGGH